MKLLSLTLMCAFICATTAAPTASDSIVPEVTQQTRGFALTRMYL